VKILYLHQYFLTPQMAGATRSYEMARRLVERGHEVHMITSRGEGGRAGWTCTDEAGIRVHWCSVPYSNRMGYARRIWAFMRFSVMAARRAAAVSGDVVFASSTPLTIALPAVYAAEKLSVPMVFEVRDLWPDTPIGVGALKNRGVIATARWLERFAYRNAAHVVALSPDMKTGVVSTGYPADRVTVVPNGSDLELFRVANGLAVEFRRSYDWLGDRPLVVYTGTLGVVNGVDYLARLAAVVGRIDPEVRFLTVGTGREEAKVRQTAEALGVLGRNFFMLPQIPKAEMPAVLSAADLATSTVIDREQLWANSANKVFDALAADRPIVINHRGWLAEMIEQTGCGLVLNPNETETAAEQLVAALRNPLWVARARAAARKAAEERFSRDLLFERLETVLRRVVPEPQQQQQRRLAA